MHHQQKTILVKACEAYPAPAVIAEHDYDTVSSVCGLYNLGLITRPTGDENGCLTFKAKLMARENHAFGLYGKG